MTAAQAAQWFANVGTSSELTLVEDRPEPRLIG